MLLIFKPLILFLISFSAFGLTFPYGDGHEVFGETITVPAQKNDTFSYYAHKYDVGALAIIRANPGVDENNPHKHAKEIIIPGAFILPAQRSGLVVNLAEQRLYYFMPSEVATYPITVGKEGWKTPLKQTTIIEKEKDPVWDVPKSILAEARAKGKPIPAVVPAGPKNPLGAYALHLGITGVLIHGTNAPASIGREASHGCIRMFPGDIEQLFQMIPVGTPVSIVNEPVKVGWRGNELFLQVYRAAKNYPVSEEEKRVMAKDAISRATAGRSVHINWDLVDKIIHKQNGIAEVINH